jgi:2-phospho-L-lactate guanylyltransferase
MTSHKLDILQTSAQATWAIVPVKTLAQAKARLEPSLSPSLRRRLVLTMLEDVLDILRRAPCIGRTLVVTADRDVAGLAMRTGAAVLREGRSSGLNAAIRLGARHARRRGATRALFIPADVPLATAAEIGRIAAAPPRDLDHPVIVPDRDGVGTNALLLSPPDALDPSFGEGSFARHCEQAVARGFVPRVMRLQGLGRDIDEPADLAALLDETLGSPRYAFLHRASRRCKTMADRPMGVSQP